MNGNITTAPLGGNRNIKTKPLFQYDYGQVLKIVGVTLPAAYEVHFSNQLHGVATTQIGNADGVIIPDIYLTTGEPVYAWIYLHTGNSDGETEYTITIPVVRRASISDAEPTPVQQDVITQAIAALNTAVEQTAQDVQDATEAKQDAEEAAGNAYESAVAAAQSAANAGTYAGQAQSAQAASELAQQKAEEAQTGAQTAKWAAESAQTAAEAAQAGAVAARTGAETAQAWAVAARSGAEAAQHAAEAARDEITGLSATANTLPAGSQATASYNDGLLTIGVPKGEKGDTGDTGATPDLTIGTVQTLPAGSSATATITGTAEDPVLNLGIPKGDQGEVSQAEFDALADDVSDMQDTLEHKADIDGYYTDMTVGAAEQVVSSTMVEDNAPYKLRTSGGSTDIGNRAYVDKVVGGTVAWNQQVRDAASENVTEYADVVTVTDAVEDDAAVSVRVEPVQDLHGYDSPWPAGGGKNKLDSQVETTGYIRGSDGAFISGVEAWRCSTVYSAILPNTDYVLHKYATSSSSVAGYAIYDEDKNYIDGHNYGSGATVSITTPQNARYIRASWGVNAATPVALMLATETDTTYAPYANLCPISGWDEVNITRSGANLLPTYTESFERDGLTYTVASDGSVTVNGTATQTTTYYASASTWKWDGVQDVWLSGCPAGGNYMNGYSLRVDPNFSGYSAPDIGNGVRLSGYTGAYNLANVPLRFCIVVRANTVCNNLVFRPMLNFGLSALPYTPYTAINSYTITLQQTVYNGVVGSEGGESRLRKRVLNGSETWTGSNASGIYTELSDMKKNTEYNVNDRMLCENLSVAINHGTMPDFSITGYVDYSGRYPNQNWLYIRIDDNHPNATSVKEWLAENPVTVVYELADPVQFAITPPAITTLLGTNHVWSDAGQLSLTYTGTDEHLTLTSGRKYLTRINGTDSMVLGAGQEVTAVKGRDNVFDLTQMLGTSVADYVYQQGAGYFRRWFGDTRYAYNAGELISVEGLQSRDVVGFNQWDEEWEVGAINHTTGQDTTTSGIIRTKGYVNVLGGMVYSFVKKTNGIDFHVHWYDADKNFISYVEVYSNSTINYNTAPAPADARYMRFNLTVSYGTTYNHDICINLSHNASRNGSYEPYTHRSYPLDSTLTLRGIPKVGTDGVYWDGDEYEYDGTVTRKFKQIVLDGVNQPFTASWGASDNGYAVYRTISDIDPNGRPLILCEKFVNANLGQASMPPWTVGGNSGAATTVTFKFPSTITSTADANNWLKNNNVTMIYPVATPTAETAQPYQQIQHVDDWGTEEFVSSSIVPVGHQSRYPQNLRDKLQHLPALASANGSYLITQTDGQMVLTPFPAPPTAAGNYLLKATVSGGNATYSWVAQ